MKGFYYEQGTGTLGILNGEFECPIAAGFAGRGDGRNNPQFEDRPNIGPVPAGVYRVRLLAHKRFAAPAFFLDPVEETRETLREYGRSGFWLHGGTESHGCPIFDRLSREAIRALVGIGFDHLRVIP